VGQERPNLNGEAMKVGDLIRHIDDRPDQFYVVIKLASDGRFKIKHTHDGWEHWRSEAACWEKVYESR